MPIEKWSDQVNVVRLNDDPQFTDDLAHRVLFFRHVFPTNFVEHVTLMHDLLAVALQADLTRVSTLMYAREGTSSTERRNTSPRIAGNSRPISFARPSNIDWRNASIVVFLRAIWLDFFS